MTYCADYDPISCPVGCYYAEETEKLNRELSSDLKDYVIMSIIYAIEIVISGLAVPVFVIVSAAERTLREKTKSQEMYLAAELEYISQYKKQQTETRAFRHDIKNNLAMAQMMLANGQTEEASAHISDGDSIPLIDDS